MSSASTATDPGNDPDFSWEVKANDRSYHNKDQKGFLCFRKKKYADNIIKTSKYNVLTFLPLNLFEQYHQPHVIYFTFVLILQSVPQISTLPVYVFVIPLILILGSRALRELINDIARHKNDTLVNNKPCEILSGKTFQMQKWKDVQVGDIVCLRKDDFVPADILLLYSTEPGSACYVETAGIDGETNLKYRHALRATHCALQTAEALAEFDGIVTCETPNSILHSFTGVLSWKDTKYSLSNNNLLLRDCRIRNTAVCYGLVIHAGRDTKIMKNCGKVKLKKSKVYDVVEKSVLYITILITIMSLFLGCGAGIWNTLYSERHYYLPPSPVSSALLGFYLFWGYFSMFCSLIPFFLYVSLELLYTAHNYFIKQDLEMYDSETDSPAQAKGNSLCDLLGEIDYVFTDKTGTLTQNVMTFRKCCIGGRIFGTTSIEEGKDQEVSFAWNKSADPSFRFYDQSLCEEICGSQDPLLHDFFRAIALCHTVMVDNNEGLLVYKAASPDEEALVTAARNFGYVFRSRTQDSITVIEMGKERTYSILALLDFDSIRKRMSILVQNEEGKIKLYTKGADCVILQRLDPSCHTETFIDVLDQFAEETLRTLCLACREVEEQDYKTWKLKCDEASVTLNNREVALEKVYAEMECDLQLIGATAIEDKLQRGVPETIQLLRDGNIKVWMLTGDKQETAVNIGYSCNLLSSDMQIVEENELRCLLETTDDCVLKERDLGETGDSSSKKALVITGDFLSTFIHTSEAQEMSAWKKFLSAFKRKEVTDQSAELRRKRLVELACQHQSVICCRMTPKQKASIVELVKKNKKVTTLAIGDGGNDVNMLKTAHVGVGIIGKEGLQAALVGDFALAQFSYLQNLLFFHGRLSFLRISNFFCFYNYKTFASLIHNFWFAFFNGFSALIGCDSWFLLWNAIMFTLYPALYIGIIDKDFDSKTSLKNPHLYIRGKRGTPLPTKIIVYILYGVYTSLVMFFTAYFGFYDTSGPPRTYSYHVFAYVVSNIYILAVIAEALVLMSSYTLLALLAVVLSLINYLVVSILCTLPSAYASSAVNFNFLGAMLHSISSGYMWLIYLFGVVVNLIPSLFFRSWCRLISPNQLAPEKGRKMKVRSAFRRGGYKRRSSYAFSHTEGFAKIVTRKECLQN
ncbi:phospholipid-transporting ATPase IK-like [Eleutherodactylus coqui]|uniref:phospholipid-transporting ATPase IK-like n=1 Tax=Eleutherodactylus coqui TaxID=57060 RepID=UPI003461F2DB